MPRKCSVLSSIYVTNKNPPPTYPSNRLRTFWPGWHNSKYTSTVIEATTISLSKESSQFRSRPLIISMNEQQAAFSKKLGGEKHYYIEKGVNRGLSFGSRLHMFKKAVIVFLNKYTPWPRIFRKLGPLKLPKIARLLGRKKPENYVVFGFWDRKFRGVSIT